MNRWIERLRAVGRPRNRIVGVHEHQIEIGTLAHLAAAELALCDRRERATRDAPMAARHLVFDHGLKAGNRRLGHRRIRGTDEFRRHRSANDVHADAEALFFGEATRGIERALVIGGRGHFRGEARAQRGLVRRPVEEAPVQEGVQHRRVAPEILRQPRRRAGDLGDQRQQRRVGAE